MMRQPAKSTQSIRKISVHKIAIGSGIAAALIFGVGSICIGIYVFSPPAVHRLALPSNLIPLDSDLGQRLLFESHTQQNYVILSQQFQTQKLPAYCGVASGAIVLNALDPSARPWNQDTFFTPAAQKIRSPYLVALLGMSLAQLAALLKSHQVQVETHYAAETTLEQFRTHIKEHLARDRDFVIVNYERADVGQVNGGHISPIAAYHEASDRFLIEDVSSYKYPPVWVSVTDLWRATNTIDVTSLRTRGYLLVRQSAAAH